MKTLSYRARAEQCSNPTAKQLLQWMEDKHSNLAISLDVTRASDLLALADLLGPKICVLKTHIDILEDFTPAITTQLMQLASHHRFMLFEDRKFADIGHTVQQQYAKGVYRIAEWADITNAHPLVGPGVIEGLKSIGLEKGRGLLLLAQMSSDQNLFTPSYTEAAVTMALAHTDFVIGFIAQQRVVNHPHLIHMTPGIHIEQKGDALGQRYVTPTQAIQERGSDIIIVGRGIYGAKDPLAAAEIYRQAGWEAYLNQSEI